MKDGPTQPVILTRPLCVYLRVARYVGGSPTEAASFSCARNAEGQSGGDGEE